MKWGKNGEFCNFASNHVMHVCAFPDFFEEKSLRGIEPQQKGKRARTTAWAMRIRVHLEAVLCFSYTKVLTVSKSFITWEIFSKRENKLEVSCIDMCSPNKELLFKTISFFAFRPPLKWFPFFRTSFQNEESFRFLTHFLKEKPLKTFRLCFF